MTVRHENGRLVVKVSPVGNYGSYLFGLLLTSGVFLWCCWIFVTAISRAHTKGELLIYGVYCLPFTAFVCIWFLLGTHIILKRLSSVELSVGGGIFIWRQQTLRWARETRVREEDVTAVIENIRWYGKTLKLTVKGKTYALGDLLEDDLKSLARQICDRLGMLDCPGGA